MNRALICVAMACVVGAAGCDAIREMIVGQVVEPRLTGPFLNAPDVTQIGQSTPDPITTSASSIHLLWTHPDASQGASYQCRIVAVNVQGVAPDTEVGTVGGTSADNTIGGQVQFDMEPGTLLPGSYRAEISIRGQQFAAIDFEVHQG